MELNNTVAQHIVRIQNMTRQLKDLGEAISDNYNGKNIRKPSI